MEIPFQVEGIELSKALLGGLNSPMFSTGNLDADPEDELLVFDIAGEVLLGFDRTDTGFEFNASLTSNFPTPYDWVFLRDYNNDGIPDLFTNEENDFAPGIAVHKGKMTDGELSFSRITFDDPNTDQFNLLYFYTDLNNFRRIPVSETNLPALVDMDSDGDLDVLTFNGGGFYAEYYENRTVEENLDFDEFKFVSADICWGNFFETGLTEGVLLNEDCYGRTYSESPPQFKVHGSAALSVFDRDADGDYDLILSDLTRDTLVYLNNGGSNLDAVIDWQETNFPTETTPATTQRLPVPSFLDVSGNGKEDMLVVPYYISSENVEVCWYYENISTDGSAVFELREKDWLVKDMIDLGTGSDPCFVDYNQDGLTDILVGTTGFYDPEIGFSPRLFLFLNTGNSTQPSYELSDSDLLGFSQFAGTSWGFSPTFGDLDGDGDEDLLIGDFLGHLHFLENTAGEGNPMEFAQTVYPYMRIDEDFSLGQNACPIIFDFNGDDLNDILVGIDRGTLAYFENIGTSTQALFNPDFTLAPNQKEWGDVLIQIPGLQKGYASPALIEVDDEVHFFLGTEYGSVIVYETFSNGLSPDSLVVASDNIGATHEGQFIRPDFADLNMDGKYEMILGNNRGGIAIYETDIDKNSVGIEQNSSDGLLVFPNPTKDFVRIVSEDYQIESVKIFSAAGQSEVLHFQQESESVLYDLSAYTDGIYFLEITLESGKLLSSKILVQ